MNGIKAFGMLIGSGGIATTLLVLYFNWRARLLSRIRGIGKEA